ncbi:MAG: Trm112 family protein [Candidatus Omnitrophota bacterium]
MINKELLNILACPACKADVKLEGDKIICTSCGRRYPIRDGIPVMLVEEAEAPEKKD